MSKEDKKIDDIIREVAQDNMPGQITELILLTRKNNELLERVLLIISNNETAT